MIVAVTGATGNMGTYTVDEILKMPEVKKIRILGHKGKKTKEFIKKRRDLSQRIDIVYGTIASEEDCLKLVSGADYVINMAAVIPPTSDKHPEAAIEANEKGPGALVNAIKAAGGHPKLIHISTVGLYGNRNHIHPFGRVGDPLLISPFDLYALTKMRGEFTVLESGLENWAVIRQTAMLYDEMLMKNVSDGLMFHTCFNAPLEWTTGRDSGRLIANILRRDIKGELDEKNFWKKCFNLGMEKNRITGYETLDDGFRLIGGSVEDFFRPDYNSMRNFHGLWFSDGWKLEELFRYQSETLKDFWDGVKKKNPVFGLAKLVPKKLIKKLVIDRLLGDSNSPYYWKKRGDRARMTAYFKGEEEFEKTPKSWNDFPLLCKGRSPEGNIDYDELRWKDTPLFYGFDFDKDDSDIDINDLRSVAEAHGGRLLSDSFMTGDMYSPVRWETQDGEEFTANPYTVLRCGHWYNIAYRKYAWDFDRLSKKDKIFASAWYDSHDTDEDHFYYFDENFEAGMK